MKENPDADQRAETRVLIYGSCVSRDTFSSCPTRSDW